MRLWILILPFAVTFWGWIFWPFNRSRYRFLPPVSVEFFHCQGCGSLEGGLYRKGPVRRAHTVKARWCLHRWQAISLREFLDSYFQQTGVNLREQPFWNQLESEAPSTSLSDDSSKRTNEPH